MLAEPAGLPHAARGHHHPRLAAAPNPARHALAHRRALADPPTDDEPLSTADRATIERALTEPGITLSVDELAALLAAGDDGEVRELIAAGKVAEAIAVARFSAFERAYNWDEPWNRPMLLDDEPLL